jgi:hypothetical protein
MAAGQGFPGGILGPGGSPFPGRGARPGQAQAQRGPDTKLPDNILMKVLVKSALVEAYTGKEISELYPVSVQGGPGMLALSEVYFHRKSTPGLFVFLQIQIGAPEYAIIMVPLPKWWTEDELKKAKAVDE